MALLVLTTLPPHLNRERALIYAILHDLAEVGAGDITPHDGVAPDAKAHAEAVAMEDLAASLPRGDALRDWWAAYERQEDPEARFVRELDRLDMGLQATVYAGQGLDPTEFLESAGGVVRDPALFALLARDG